MNTPLQKAAQAVIDRWDSPTCKDQPHTAEYIVELRKALEAEIAQSSEPVARVESIMANGRPFISRLPGARLNEGDSLYLHPPQQVVPSGERAELIAQLNKYAAGDEFQRVIEQAADIMEADVSLINEGNKAQQAKQVPMSTEQITKAWETVKGTAFGYAPFARTIEAHHGIRGQP